MNLNAKTIFILLELSTFSLNISIYLFFIKEPKKYWKINLKPSFKETTFHVNHRNNMLIDFIHSFLTLSSNDLFTFHLYLI